MTAEDLRSFLGTVGLSQNEFARLVDVTPRAVSLWLAGDRAVPGPVEAYVRLLAAAPASVRQVEFSRLRQERTAMREGFYGIEYASAAGSGFGVLILDSGRAYGADGWGGRYDGDYIFDDATGLAGVKLTLAFRPNTPTVFGISHPHDWTIDVTTRLDPRKDAGSLRLQAPVGAPVDIAYRFLRPLPEA